MSSHPTYLKKPIQDDAPPPVPNMENHPAMKKKKALEAEEEEDIDYLVPEDESDDMAQRPPAPLPSTIPGAPVSSPLQPLLEQQYINVDSRPPEPPPMDYENFDDGPQPPPLGPKPMWN